MPAAMAVAAGACSSDHLGGSGPACRDNADCDSMSYCKSDGCGDTGTCAGKPDLLSCGSNTGPDGSATGGGTVCGCDHRTYSNACEAAWSGVSVQQAGACVLPPGPCTSQADCGGASYAKVVYCATTTCGGAGVCTLIPEVCPALYVPVCGCDGKTYPNDCAAQMVAASIDYPGACRSGAAAGCDDATPCPDGDACLDDPRDTCTGPGCPRICVGSWSACGPFTSSNGDLDLACIQGACVVGPTGCSGDSGPPCPGMCTRP